MGSDRAAESGFVEYARAALAEFDAYDSDKRFMMVDAVGESDAQRVLDVGCGAGQQLLPFAERQDSFCVGIDVGGEVGEIGAAIFAEAGLFGKGNFIRARGEDLPFPNESFDVVICRVALPYMDSRKAIAEMSRVLRAGGKFILKIHAPGFYLWMLKARMRTLSPKQLAYPIICLMCGTLDRLSGRRPSGAFWQGKEVYQTRKSLTKELIRNGMVIVGELADSNPATPSFLIEKQSA